MADTASIEYKTSSSVLTQSMASRRLKRDFWPQFPKLRFLRRQNFLRIFLPFGSVGFCLRAWAMGPRLPEAGHRCIWQPSRVVVQPTTATTATFRSSSGSSRPRRRWMRRPTKAVASDEDLGRENLLRQWDFFLLDASLFCGSVLPELFALILCVVCRNICSNIWCFLLRPCCLH